MLDFIRIACAVPPVKPGHTAKNTEDICRFLRLAEEKGCDLVVFPELSITGYTCQDLFYQQTLLKGAVAGLKKIAEVSENYPALTAVVGLPLAVGTGLYNCAAVVNGGCVRGIVPKTFLANDGAFTEKRWFRSANDLLQDSVDLDLGYIIPVGADLLFSLGEEAVLGVEICQDLWAPVPPSSMLCLSGADVIVNLSASNETVSGEAYRRDLVRHQSAASQCVYAFCSAGYTESTQDLVYSGHSMIAENGALVAERCDLSTDYLLVKDVDLGKLQRAGNSTFGDSAAVYAQPVRVIPCGEIALRGDGSLATLNKAPFTPADKAECMAIFQTQVAGLKQRLKTIGANAVVGVSGGLDSTLALLVAVEAMNQLGRPASDVYGVTLPCFGTSDRTYQNALSLMDILGINSKEINIRDAVTGHFKDIGHDMAVRNGTYENAQARERTQILMDYASVVGGIVVGTGDLSELALGWCTYNGDHMSMYGVNGSVPKTLIPHIISAATELPGIAPAKAILQDVIDTPISPELLPPDESGKISQQTEDIVGPYVLHDFFLYYLLKFGYCPKKIYALACQAFQGEFDGNTIKKWLSIFCRRFFTQQFKRNCLPDGVAIGSVSLSPRGSFMMPSDATAKLWLEEIETL